LSLGVGLDPGSDYPGFRYGCKKVTKEAKASLRAALPGSWFRPRQWRRDERLGCVRRCLVAKSMAERKDVPPIKSMAVLRVLK
jgi:hypothetical protein